MLIITSDRVDELNLPIAEMADIYMRNKSVNNKCIIDFLDMLSFIRLDINNIQKVPYAPYWDFLDEIANNIDTGKWKTHPYMWNHYIMNASYLPMTEHAVNQRCTALRNRCIKILEDSGIPINGLSNRQLLLRWARNPNGYQDIMSTVKTMIELNKLFSKKGK